MNWDRLIAQYRDPEHTWIDDDVLKTSELRIATRRV